MISRYIKLRSVIAIFWLTLFSWGVHALTIFWTARGNQQENSFTSELYKSPGEAASVGYTIPPNFPAALGISQTGPTLQNNHNPDILTLMLNALGQQINSRRLPLTPAPPPNSHTNQAVSLKIFPLHWLTTNSLPFLRGTIVMDSFHFLPNTVYVNLGYPATSPEGQSSFYFGVILYRTRDIFNVIVSSQILDDQLVSDTVHSALTNNNQSNHPFFHANLTFQDMAEITSQSVPANWPTNTALQLSLPARIEQPLQPVASSSPPTAVVLLRVLTIVFCCYCFRSTR